MTALVSGTLASVLPTTVVAAGSSRATFGTQSWISPHEQDIAAMKRGRVGTLRALFDGALEWHCRAGAHPGPAHPVQR